MLPRSFSASVFASAVAVLALPLASCTGEVVSESQSDSSGSAGAGATGTASAGGSKATGTASSAGGSNATGGVAGGGTGGAGATGGTGECVPQSDGGGGFMEPTCKDLDVLTVSDPVLKDADGDGLVEAGEMVTIEVNLNEVAGVGFNYYPGVTFQGDTVGVSVSSNNWLYAILPCQSYTLNGQMTVGGEVPVGSVVTITARVAMLNHDCPDAYSIDIPFQVH